MPQTTHDSPQAEATPHQAGPGTPTLPTGPAAMTFTRRHWPKAAALLIILLGLGLTMVGTRHELHAAQRADQDRFDRLADRLKGELVRRVLVYHYGLKGSQALFPASNSVERSEFRAMVESRDLEIEFPGALGIGYIHRVENNGLAVDDFVMATRQEGAPEFTITVPPGAAPLPGSVIDDRLIIEFIEPVENNRPAQGLDIGSHPVRREAAERAMLTGEGSITGRIDLVQDDQKFAGFLYLLPVYTKGMPTATPEDRIAATVGWVYMPMIAPPVFDSAVGITDGELDFEVFDGVEPTTTNIIYDGDGHLAEARPGPIGDHHYTDRTFHVYRPLEIGGRTWTVSISSTDAFAAASLHNAWNVGVAGSVLTLLLATLVYLQGSSTRRAQALAVGMTSDLRRYADAAQAATRAKSDFVANMSHEIRTPITAILGYADLLRTDPEAQSSQSKRLEYTATIERSGKHLLTIINDILDMSKIEAGKLTTELIETQPAQIVQEVMSLMAVKAHDKGIAIDIVYTTPIPETIQSDPLRLRQMLLNLVGNAIKFTRAGSVRVELALDPDAQTLACSISDTGIGMTPEQVDRLFNAFEQADTSTSREYGGSGLGLQISRRLAEMLGGRLDVESETGRGSSFTLIIPTGPLEGVSMLPAGPANVVSQAVPDPATAPVQTIVDADKPLDGMHILLAEDGVDNQRLISFHLKRAGAEVTVVENGQLAVEALTTDGTVDGPLRTDKPYDLLLTDMQMPVMDGYSSVSILRGKGSNLPIVALTAHAMAGDEKGCLDCGCDDYATKPIDRVGLINVCQKSARPVKRRKDVA